MKFKKNLKLMSISTAAISMITIPSIVATNLPTNFEHSKNVNSKTEDWHFENDLIFGERLTPLDHFNKYGIFRASRAGEDREYYYVGLDLDTSGLKLRADLDGIYIRMYELNKNNWKYDINSGLVAYYPGGYAYGGWANSGYKVIKIKKTESGRWVKFRVLFPWCRDGVDLHTVYNLNKFANTEFYIEPIRSIPKFTFEVFDLDKRKIDAHLNMNGYFMVNDKIRWNVEWFDGNQYFVASKHEVIVTQELLSTKKLHFNINKTSNFTRMWRVSGTVIAPSGYNLIDFNTNTFVTKGLPKDVKEVPFDIFDVENIEATNKSSLSLLVNNIIDGKNKLNSDRALQEVYNQKLLWGIFLGDSVAAKYGLYALEQYGSISIARVEKYGTGYKWYAKLKTEAGYKFRHKNNGEDVTEVYKSFVVENRMVEPAYPPEILE